MFLKFNDKCLTFANLKNINSIKVFSEKVSGTENKNYLIVKYKNGEFDELFYSEAIDMIKDLNKLESLSK